MITKSQLEELERLFSEAEQIRMKYEPKIKQAKIKIKTAEDTFLQEKFKLRCLLRTGESTGDLILDWALNRDYPSKEGMERAEKIKQYLQENEGDICLYLAQNYPYSQRFDFYIGRIISPFLSYSAGTTSLSLVFEDGTLVCRKSYIDNFIQQQGELNHSWPNEINQPPSVEGLINSEFNQRENGSIESSSVMFSEDNDYHLLAAGEEIVLSYLKKINILPEATREHLDKLLR